MRLRLFAIVFTLTAAFVNVLAGCTPVAPTEEGTVTVTDLLGREVSVPVDVDSVVAIGPGALRLVVYAGDLNMVSGIEQMDAERPLGRPYMLANPQLAELPVIGQGGPNNAPDPERILTVWPDVILSTYTTDASAANELQAKTGIPVVAISYGASGFGTTTMFGEIVQNSLRLVGQITGTEKKAQIAIDILIQAQDDLGTRTSGIADDGKPSVYVGGLGARGTHGIESTQGKYALLDAIHARNVVDETGESGSVMIDKEKLLAWNPDVLIVDEGGLAALFEDYQKNPVFYESLSAVQNGSIYAQLPYNYYNTNLDTAIADAYYLGTVIYPDAFADIDPVPKANQIYEDLLGQPVYEQMAESFGGFKPLNLGAE